ncbi:RecQ family ATP-dependent DNA helicase [Alkalicoccus urumqiensis]|uniref:ATP-dependent DNA helicase RecQ n=1 Tax=Alkalicoccus urumqiensis TaxID=1548213 RepID=A0A2P6MKJ9_ALKUR|nr:RecQ family ATP-dependent DNA helicase [Alkalicoccus urumqiensis]PRO66783.1 ATP-dependent DNA helicase [Alkalicoccus urumqiensis]
MLKDAGFTSFRPGQEEVIRSVMKGEDTLAVLPTGGGKTLCYDLPSRMLQGLTVVVSPLVSLMQDQVTQLQSQGRRRVESLTGQLSFQEKKDILYRLPQLNMLFLSPEMLQSERIKERLKQLTISLFVVDEAHCISQWGHEFRPDYKSLAGVIEELHRPVVLALTATATPQVEADIKELLKLNHPFIYRRSVNRRNIFLEAVKVENREEKWERLEREMEALPKPMIIYTGTRKEAEEAAAKAGRNFSAACYHAGMSPEERRAVQLQFVEGSVSVLAATNAFGMGINKKDIRSVVHLYLPPSLEQYVQETGRAGRDGSDSIAVLLAGPEEERLQMHLIQSALPEKSDLFRYMLPVFQQQIDFPHETLPFPEVVNRTAEHHFEQSGLLKNGRFQRVPEREDIDRLGSIYEARRRIKLRQFEKMLSFYTDTECLRKQILRYFQEEAEAQQNCCSVCGLRPEIASSQLFFSNEETGWENRLIQLFYPERRHEIT